MAYLSGFGQLDPYTGLPKKQAQAGGFTTGAYGAPAPIGMAPSTNPVGYTPPALPGSTPVGGGQPSGGSTMPQFDVQGLLDSLLNPIKADMAAQGQVDLAGRNAGINRALTQFGAVPDFSQAQKTLGLDVGSVIDPGTAQLAANNPYSATKQITQAHVDALRNIKHALAARGMLQSGELGFQLNRENQSYGQNQYDATQKLLDFIGALQQGYLSAERARQASLANAGNSALQQLMALFPGGFPSGGGGQQQAPPPPSGGARTGGAPAESQPTGGYLNVGPGVRGPYIGTVPQDVLKRMGQNY